MIVKAQALMAMGSRRAAATLLLAGLLSAVISAPAYATQQSGSWHAREGMYFQRAWGVDFTGVKAVSSGYMLRLSYRIVDPGKAKPLTDVHNRAYLIDEASGVRLAVPAMENVGELRQTGKAQANRSYFVIFGNPGRLVKPGSRVSLVVGNFRADGLIVD